MFIYSYMYSPTLCALSEAMVLNVPTAGVIGTCIFIATYLHVCALRPWMGHGVTV